MATEHFGRQRRRTRPTLATLIRTLAAHAARFVRSSGAPALAEFALVWALRGLVVLWLAWVSGTAWSVFATAAGLGR
jgi:hypothetical protein